MSLCINQACFIPFLELVINLAIAGFEAVYKFLFSCLYFIKFRFKVEQIKRDKKIQFLMSQTYFLYFLSIF